MKRMTEVTGGDFKATYGENQEKRSAEYNMKYAVGPMFELIEQYNKLVDDAQYEINGLHTMLNSKNLDQTKLQRENNRFLSNAQ